MKHLIQTSAFLAVTAGAFPIHISAIDFDSIPFWTGSGTNRAALVVHWSAPEVRDGTSVPNPVADKSFAWGYRWNGTATAEDLLRAIAAADSRLFAAINVSQFGASVLALGYDLNNNRVFGLSSGATELAPAAFTNGIVSLSTSSVDEFRSLDSGDLFWSGWTGPGWDTWQEAAGVGGFTNAPDRGASPYWTPGDPTQPYFGSHGEWDLAGLGISSLDLKDGSWIGFSVSGGAFDFMNPNSPGTLAYNFKKQAPAAPQWAPVAKSPFAVEIVSAQGPFGAAPYDEPSSLLGMPGTDYFDPFGDFGGGTKNRRVKIVEAPFGTDASTNKLITTLDDGSSIIVRFDQAVTNDPANPYGIDFLVFGNSFYTGDGFVNDAANMNEIKITGGLFAEPLKVSVSPGFTGLAGEVENDPSTWPWYRYESGPYADSAFPTQGYLWNRSLTNWSARPMDFTKPVNPSLAAVLDAGGISVADAIDLYAGSGGGTGFDLAPSGFSSIRYAKVEGQGLQFSGGEIDAFARVRPAAVGDALTITALDVSNGQNRLRFQDPVRSSSHLLELNFTNINDAAEVSVGGLSPTNLVSAGVGLQLLDIRIAPLFAASNLTFTAGAVLHLDGVYSGNGDDLNLLKWDGTNWVSAAGFSYDAASKTVALNNLTNSAAVIVERVAPAPLKVTQEAAVFAAQFPPIVGWTHVLERTTNFADWTGVATNTPATAQTTTLRDENPPGGNAFYRLRVIRSN